MRELISAIVLAITCSALTYVYMERRGGPAAEVPKFLPGAESATHRGSVRKVEKLAAGVVTERTEVTKFEGESVSRPNWSIGGALHYDPGSGRYVGEVDVMRRMWGDIWLGAGVTPERREASVLLRIDLR